MAPRNATAVRETCPSSLNENTNQDKVTRVVSSEEAWPHEERDDGNPDVEKKQDSSLVREAAVRQSAPLLQPCTDGDSMQQYIRTDGQGQASCLKGRSGQSLYVIKNVV